MRQRFWGEVLLLTRFMRDENPSSLNTAFFVWSFGSA